MRIPFIKIGVTIYLTYQPEDGTGKEALEKAACKVRDVLSRFTGQLSLAHLQESLDLPTGVHLLGWSS